MFSFGNFVVMYKEYKFLWKFVGEVITYLNGCGSKVHVRGIVYYCGEEILLLYFVVGHLLGGLP